MLNIINRLILLWQKGYNLVWKTVSNVCIKDRCSIDPERNHTLTATATSTISHVSHFSLSLIVQQQHSFNGRLSRTTQVSRRYQKGKTKQDLLKQETVSGSGISCNICKSAPCSRHVTTLHPNTQVFWEAGCHSCHTTNSVKALKAACLWRYLSSLRWIYRWIMVNHSLKMQQNPSTDSTAESCGLNEPCMCRDARWHHLANTTERSVIPGLGENAHRCSSVYRCYIIGCWCSQLSQKWKIHPPPVVSEVGTRNCV